MDALLCFLLISILLLLLKCLPYRSYLLSCIVHTLLCLGWILLAQKWYTDYLLFKTRYFIVKSCNRENLEISVQQGVWATQRSNEAKLNEAFESTENVILIFSINKTRHFQVLQSAILKIYFPSIIYTLCH